MLTALPKYGPASRRQRIGGLGTPALRAIVRVTFAAARDQANRISGRMKAGTWLWIGEQVSWWTGVRPPSSAFATYE